jgi:CubicO group peptidase (beta-lactamase class C family)
MGRAAVKSQEIADICKRVGGESGFSGVVRVDLADGSTIEHAGGLADRRWNMPFTVEVRMSIASATKGFTALAVMALVEDGLLSLDTTARSLLGTDLPLIDDGVTIEHLLAHRSGIGDYFDESSMGDISDYVMPVAVHLLDSTESYLDVLDGHDQVTAPGQTFAYNNGGFVVLALLIERAASRPFEQLIDELVCRPAGLTDTSFIRSDSLPPGVATGYLGTDGLLTNSLHLPVLGSGDGGLFSTTADVRQFWVALFAGSIVSSKSVKLMTQPRSHHEDRRYGLGFWLPATGPHAMLAGYDPGVSFRSCHNPLTGQTYTVIGNTSEGAWPLVRALAEMLDPH